MFILKRSIESIAHSVFAVSLILAFVSCEKAKTFRDLDKLEKYASGENSSFRQSVTRNGIRLTLRYMPSEVMMLPHYREFEAMPAKFANAPASQAHTKLEEARKQLRKQKEIYDRSLYFYLNIGYADPHKRILYDNLQGLPYGQWIQRLTFELQSYLHLETPTAANVPLTMYHMPRTYDSQSEQSFLLMFLNDDEIRKILRPKDDWLKLHIDDFGLGTGHVVFEFHLPFEKIKYDPE